MLLLSAAPALADCTVYRSASEAPGIEQLFERMAAARVGSPNDDPNVNNAGMTEEGPDSLVLLDLWIAERSNRALPVVRFVQHGKGTDVELPEGRLATPIGSWPCLLAPGDQVYLSDGFTDHSTMVYRIDTVAQEVTFLDPRADEVFLLREKRVLEDFGGRWWTEGDRKLFAVPFGTMDITLRLAQLSALRPPEATLGAAAALAPDIPAILLRYWHDAQLLATFNPASVDSGAFGYVAEPVQDNRLSTLPSYLRVLAEVGPKMWGSAEPLKAGFGHSVEAFPLQLSKNMNFRVAIDLVFAGELGEARALIERYIEVRGWDLDFAVLGFAVCRDLGETICAADYKAAAQAELEARLARMFRGSSAKENKAMLAASTYGNATQMLVRERYDWLD